MERITTPFDGVPAATRVQDEDRQSIDYKVNANCSRLDIFLLIHPSFRLGNRKLLGRRGSKSLTGFYNYDSGPVSGGWLPEKGESNSLWELGG